eukprot:11971012-Prorocentrum_lima.AAC.1
MPRAESSQSGLSNTTESTKQLRRNPIIHFLVAVFRKGKLRVVISRISWMRSVKTFSCSTLGPSPSPSKS